MMAYEADEEMPARVQMILKAIANPKRTRVLRILNSKGSLAYSELKGMVGYRTKNESGKFAYHLRQLRKHSLVYANKNEKQYTITNLGKMVLSMIKQVEERSVVESGQMYVRTSSMAIEEFNSDKILQSLVREGRLPMDMAERVTVEVEKRIRKYQADHLTGPLIREMVNAVLLESGQEEYRHRMTRLGMPAYDVQEMLTDSAPAGLDSVAMAVGRSILSEYLMTNTLPKDVADMHMGGYLNISDPAGWSLVPDTLFVEAADLLDGSVSWGAGTPRMAPEGGAAADALSAALRRISWEASGEVVVDGMEGVMRQYGMAADVLARALAAVHRGGARITMRVPLEDDAAGTMLDAYKEYIGMASDLRVGIVADPGDGIVDGFADVLAELSTEGGSVGVGRGRVAASGVTDTGGEGTTLKLHSMAVNLPRLAYTADSDEKYFRVLMAMRVAPAIAALKERRKDIMDITRRGLNPFLASKAPYDKKGTVQLLINLVGMREAVGDVMGYTGEKTHPVCIRGIKTAVASAKKERRGGVSVDVCMAPSMGSARLVELDGKEYGKVKIPMAARGGEYGQGRAVDIQEAIVVTASDSMAAEIRETAAVLGGGLYVGLQYDDGTPRVDVAEGMRRMAPICGFTLGRR